MTAIPHMKKRLLREIVLKSATIHDHTRTTTVTMTSMTRMFTSRLSNQGLPDIFPPFKAYEVNGWRLPVAACYNPPHEKMAILGWSVNQRSFHLAGAAGFASR